MIAVSKVCCRSFGISAALGRFWSAACAHNHRCGYRDVLGRGSYSSALQSRSAFSGFLFQCSAVFNRRTSLLLAFDHLVTPESEMAPANHSNHYTPATTADM